MNKFFFILNFNFAILNLICIVFNLMHGNLGSALFSGFALGMAVLGCLSNLDN